MKKQAIFDTSAPNKSTRIINGECSGILNWDDIRMPHMHKLYKVLLANHWIPDEMPMNIDKTNFTNLSANEKQAFKKIIGLLAVLDSMQTMFVMDIKDYLTDSSLQAIAAIIGQQEVVHNQSYSYVLSSIFPKKEQDEIFEYWKYDEILLNRNLFIRDAYQNFRDNPTPETFFIALVCDMILEGIFFYVGFAFFYNLAREGRDKSEKMMTTAAMIAYIQRDEGQHTYFFAECFKQLLADYPELDTTANRQYVYDMFDKAVKSETEWANYVLTDIAGIDLDEFANYIKFVANKRLRLMDFAPAYEGVENSMPWIRPFSDETLNDTKTDFFEGKSRTYAKASAANDWEDL